MGERTITMPIGYRNKVVLSRKGNTATERERRFSVNFVFFFT